LTDFIILINRLTVTPSPSVSRNTMDSHALKSLAKVGETKKIQ